MSVNVEKLKELYKEHSIQSFQKRLEKIAYGRKYNVEYELGNGVCHTFSNVLVAVNDNRLYFESEENGLDIITTDSIRTMICMDRKSRW